MKPTFTAVVACAALAGLVGLSQPATAQQKTTRQCNDEWAANKASIQASGKTKRVFVAECRGVPIVARAPATAAPAGKDQYATEAEAKANCPADTVVWVNPRSMDTTGTWPFGRRLEDQVATRFLSLFLDMDAEWNGKKYHVELLNDQALWDAAPIEPKTPPNPLKNDKDFLDHFPYLAEPW